VPDDASAASRGVRYRLGRWAKLGLRAASISSLILPEEINLMMSSKLAVRPHLIASFCRVTVAVLASGAIVVGSAVSAGAAGAAQNGTLSNGAVYTLRPVGGAAVTTIALWFRTPAASFDVAAQPGLGRVAVAAVAESKPVTSTSLADFIEGIGGQLTIDVSPENIGVATSVPADQAAAAIQALTRAYFAPVLTDAGLVAAKSEETDAAQVHAFSPGSGIESALYGSLFAAAPSLYSTFGTPASIEGMGLDQVRAFAERAFRAPNAVVVASGDVDHAILASVIPGRERGEAGDENERPVQVAAAPAPVALTGSTPGFGLAWAGPPISDERAATALDFVADYLFAPGTGLVQRAAASSGTNIVGTFLTFHNPGVFMVTATGGDITAARNAVDAAVRDLQHPLAPAIFAQAQRAFTYRTLSDVQTPSALAASYGWYTAEGDAAYAPGVDGAKGRYLAALAALTPKFVAATVARYLSRTGATVSVTSPKVAEK
jgi:predicted Zn-dependent peptidase